MDSEPFLIADFRTGKQIDREPWLLPKDAFETLRNCHIRKGVLEKRKGYAEFGQIVHTDTDTEADTNPGNAVMGIYAYYKSGIEYLVAMDTARVNKYNSVSGAFEDLTRNKIHFKHKGTQNWQPSVNDVVKGATSNATGTVKSVVVDRGTVGAQTLDGTVVFKNGTVSGTFQDGEELQNNADALDILGDANGANSDMEFTGDETNFFWWENWNDIGYFVNNTDQIQKYDGTDLSRLYIDLDVEGGPDNDVDTCLMIISYKSRLILLRTTERGTARPQRARYCDVNNPQTWPDDNYVDAPTEDYIITADFMGDDLIVWFERSIWRLTYTSDATLPFRWDKLVDTEGCYATMSLISFSDEQISVGPTRIVGTDGREAYGVDDKIPDLMLSWNQQTIGYCYGLVLEEMSQAWITYAEVGEDYPNSILVLNYEDNAWSTYEIDAHVMGYSSLETTLTMDDIDETWDQLAISWDDRDLQAGYPTTLMGFRDGKIYQANWGDADDGEAIEFNAISGRWNPYTEEGKKAWLDKIDFLVDKRTTGTFQVKLYVNSESSAYKTVTVSCTDTGTNRQTVWKQVEVNCTGDFHRIEITNNATGNRPRIHAIMPWFAPSGELI